MLFYFITIQTKALQSCLIKLKARKMSARELIG
jgi:hypothetical protein